MPVCSDHSLRLVRGFDNMSVEGPRPCSCRSVRSPRRVRPLLDISRHPALRSRVPMRRSLVHSTKRVLCHLCRAIRDRLGPVSGGHTSAPENRRAPPASRIVGAQTQRKLRCMKERSCPRNCPHRLRGNICRKERRHPYRESSLSRLCSTRRRGPPHLHCRHQARSESRQPDPPCREVRSRVFPEQPSGRRGCL